MLALDEQLFAQLIADLPITGSTLSDIGCGTGRHWTKLLARQPARLIGFDVSAGMLDQLKKKHPDAETFLLHGSSLSQLETASCDILISTLTVAHIPDIKAALTEWTRVLKPNGTIIITDYHPEALARGGQRTFRDDEQVIAVRNFVYPIYEIKTMAASLNLHPIQTIEKKIDASMRPWYTRQNAEAIFERFVGTPIIYGLHLKKTDVAN